METEAAAAPQPAAVNKKEETPQVKAPLSEIAEKKTAVREKTTETRKKAERPEKSKKQKSQKRLRKATPPTSRKPLCPLEPSWIFWIKS